MRQILATLAVVALLLVAGCSGLTGPSDGGELTEEEMPPGVTQQGVANATVLADAHRQALTTSGFQHSLHTNYTMQTEVGNQSFDSAQDAAAKPNLTEYHMVVKQDVQMGDGSIGTVHTEIWGNESTTLLRLSRGNRTAYRQVPANSPQFNASRSTTFAPTLAGYLQLGNYTIADSERRDGTTYITLNATGIDEKTVPTSFDVENVSNYTGQVVVDSEGRIHSLDTRLEMQTQYGNATVRVDYRLQQTGDVTVEQPTWTATALNRTANR